jgi:hypothetical protein
LLEVHRDHVRNHVAELQSCLLVLDSKIAGYAGADQRMKVDDAPSNIRRKPVRPRTAGAISN